MSVQGNDFTKVLLIEDDPDDREIIRDLLFGRATSRYCTYFVETVATTEEARKIARFDRHDLYIVDFYLGPSDRHETGLDFVREMFREPDRPPVILISGQERFTLDAETMKWVADDRLVFLHKNDLNKETLFNAIDRVIGRFMRILLVEDEPDDYEIALYHFKLAPGHRFKVHWAKSILEAKLELDEHDFDAVLVDYKLGSECGLSLIQHLIEKNSKLPLVLFTGLSELSFGEDIMRLLARGQLEFLAKQDLSPKKIVQCLNRAVSH